VTRYLISRPVPQRLYGLLSPLLRFLGRRPILVAGHTFDIGRVLLLNGRILLVHSRSNGLSRLHGGPFLLPGSPAIPAPEFCALGADETSDLVVWLSAALALNVAAIAVGITIHFIIPSVLMSNANLERRSFIAFLGRQKLVPRYSRRMLLRLTNDNP
jgi:hypothetical protein